MNSSNIEPLPNEIISATESFHYKPPKSSQYYQIVCTYRKKKKNFFFKFLNSLYKYLLRMLAKIFLSKSLYIYT